MIRSKVINILYIVLFFLAPLSKAGSNILFGLLIIFAFFEKDLMNKIKKEWKNEIVKYSIFFFLFILFSLIWSDNLDEGIKVIKKARFFLFLPFLMILSHKIEFKYCKISFISSTIFMVFFSYLLYFGVNLPENFINEKTFYTPFHHHVVHGVFVSIGIYLLLRELFFIKQNKFAKVFIAIISLLMIYNVLFTKGRAGQLIMFLSFFFILLEKFKGNIKKILFSTFIVLPLLIVFIYNFNMDFRKRFDEGIRDIKVYKVNPRTSLGFRFTMWENCINIIKKNKVIGVGAGDFEKEYSKEINKKHKFLNYLKRNPHSYYMLILVRFGLIGTMLFIAILFKQFFYFLKLKDDLMYFRVFLTTSIFTINFFDIYLQKHTILLTFILFTSILYKTNSKELKTSLIITTYNRKDALKLVLKSILRQSVKPYEIIIADDGSNDGTDIVVKEFEEKIKIPIIYSWQEDKGFRAAESRNLAVSKSSGEYIVFSDGDMILHKNFIEDHINASKKGFFLQGSRVFLSKKITELLVNDESIDLNVLKNGINNKINGLRCIFLTKIILFFSNKKFKGVRSCNFSLFKDDLVKVNGFNNDFVGWGYEDSELVARLYNYGLKRRKIKFAAIQYHLFHTEKKPTERNNDILNYVKINNIIKCKNGINKYIGENNEN